MTTGVVLVLMHLRVYGGETVTRVYKKRGQSDWKGRQVQQGVLCSFAMATIGRTTDGVA